MTPVTADRLALEAIVPPFFVMGCEASGTNLVSLILNSHSRLAVCRGSQYYLLFKSERRFYGPLRDRPNLVRFIEDFRETARANHVDAPALGDILRVLPEPTFEGVLAAFLHLYALREGKVRAGERSFKQYLFLRDILEGFPRSPVVFTMRDPRDLVLAHRKGFGFDVEAATGSWNQAFRAWASASRPVHLVRYEELVQRPDETLRAVCQSLGEPFEPGMLRFYEKTPEQFQGLRHHERLFTPLDPGSVGEFRQMDEREIARIEAICAVGMRAVGYEPAVARTSAPPSIAPQTPGPPGFLRFVRHRLRYYRWSKERWTRGLVRWKILLRARLRYALHLGFRRAGG